MKINNLNIETMKEVISEIIFEKYGKSLKHRIYGEHRGQRNVEIISRKETITIDNKDLNRMINLRHLGI